jgi:hypothetical protein
MTVPDTFYNTAGFVMLSGGHAICFDSDMNVVGAEKID